MAPLLAGEWAAKPDPKAAWGEHGRRWLTLGNNAAADGQGKSMGGGQSQVDTRALGGEGTPPAASILGTPDSQRLYKGFIPIFQTGNADLLG